MKKIILVITFLVLTTLCKAQSIDVFFSKTDAFFDKYVKDNKVDYDAIKKNDDALENILEIASKIDISKEGVNTTKAFWINAYNLSVIKGIVSRYPVKSPLDISGFFDKMTFTISGKKVTLNTIENKMIRAKYDDARVHFALVCGANGCPPIISNAYMPNTLEEQLNKQTKLAVNNPSFIKVNEESKKIIVSQIFEWYKDDFISKNSKEIDFINKYRTDKIGNDFKIIYYKYDWTLNKKK
ncbi:DUF547 domain-containing protein [Flavobacterium sp.]|uniref:DUF547 domain-containing protein n=1 Tax=Flavobacterium sp. TaxID=239 RepID=UPI00286D6AD5|nr:DUF547 domain-containing protein [Flavobacterium sp.]